MNELPRLTPGILKMFLKETNLHKNFTKNIVSTDLLFQCNTLLKHQVQGFFNIIYISVAKNEGCHGCKA